MRVGIVTGEYPPMQGGVGAYSQIIARHIARAGHQVFVFADARAQEDDTAIHLTAEAHRWHVGTLRRVRAWARENRLDVMNYQFETAAYGMSPWVHFLPDVMTDCPVVTTFHDLLVPYLFPKAGPLRRWIVNRLARASDGVITTNHEDMQALESMRLPCAALIPIGSNITVSPESEPLRANTGDDDYLIAHFGFINHSKGIETLLRAVSLLRADSLPQAKTFPAKLVMIGGRTGSSDPTNAAYADEIDRLIDKLNLRDHIHWTGYVDDSAVSGYLTGADVVVLPFRDGASYRRGSLMAALQHGCPIITTRPNVDIPTFKHGKNMLLFPPGNIEALIALLKQHHAGEWSGIRAGAHQLAPHFDWNHITQELLRVFEQVQS
jgi:glycosyltransferase involved in cell wall biosynthesis